MKCFPFACVYPALTLQGLQRCNVAVAHLAYQSIIINRASFKQTPPCSVHPGAIPALSDKAALFVWIELFVWSRGGEFRSDMGCVRVRVRVRVEVLWSNIDADLVKNCKNPQNIP